MCDNFKNMIHGKLPLQVCIENNCPSDVEILLSYGADPNSLTSFGTSMIWYAVSLNLPDIVKLLLPFNDVTISFKGVTPFQICINRGLYQVANLIAPYYEMDQELKKQICSFDFAIDCVDESFMEWIIEYDAMKCFQKVDPGQEWFELAVRKKRDFMAEKLVYKEANVGLIVDNFCVVTLLKMFKNFDRRTDIFLKIVEKKNYPLWNVLHYEIVNSQLIFHTFFGLDIVSFLLKHGLWNWIYPIVNSGVLSPRKEWFLYQGADPDENLRKFAILAGNYQLVKMAIDNGMFYSYSEIDQIPYNNVYKLLSLFSSYDLNKTNLLERAIFYFDLPLVYSLLKSRVYPTLHHIKLAKFQSFSRRDMLLLLGAMCRKRPRLARIELLQLAKQYESPIKKVLEGMKFEIPSSLNEETLTCQKLESIPPNRRFYEARYLFSIDDFADQLEKRPLPVLVNPYTQKELVCQEKIKKLYRYYCLIGLPLRMVELKVEKEKRDYKREFLELLHGLYPYLVEMEDPVTVFDAGDFGEMISGEILVGLMECDDSDFDENFYMIMAIWAKNSWDREGSIFWLSEQMESRQEFEN